MTTQTLDQSENKFGIFALIKIAIPFSLTLLALEIFAPSFVREIHIWPVLLCVIYFLPAVMAYAYDKKNATAIFLLNLLLGWTILGWIIALVWSAMKD